jgi:hypothetical protein
LVQPPSVREHSNTLVKVLQIPEVLKPTSLRQKILIVILKQKDVL